MIYGYGQREDNSRLRNKAKLKEINKLENKIEQLQELTKELTHAYESIQSNSSSEEEKFRKMEEMIKVISIFFYLWNKIKNKFSL